jgi:poly-gamma-glutamate synthesis protein (capsule biosynthesis protein)
MGRRQAGGVGTAWAAAALPLLVACTATDGDPRPAPASEVPTSAETQDETPSPPTPRQRPVRIAFAGDIHFEGVLAARLRDPGTALAPVTDALAGADLALANLETSVGSGGRPEPGKRYTFSAGTAAFTALAAAGIDVVSMANNHALDFGRARLPSTLRAARAAARAEPALRVVGIGADVDAAYRPVVTEVGGAVVATLAASVADQDPTADPTRHWAATADRPGIAVALDPSRLVSAVRRADRGADVVVAYLHWGVQGERCPSADQQALAGRLVRAGADVVVGSHAHRLQGDGRLGRGYVAYGLGNYAWYSPGTAASARTGVLTLTVRPPARPSGRARVVRAAWQPAVIGVDGLPAPVAGEEAAAFRADRRSLRACAGLGD